MNTHCTLSKALLLMVLAAGGAQAQQVYRIVGPDGKVTFSDRPPENSGAKARGSGATPTPTAPAADTTQLPTELKAVAQRFPVTLYTGKDCGPCDNARSMLKFRGVPYTEKTVQSNADIDALKRISGDNTLPFGTIGGQFLKGYSDTEWSQYLDAAGYPAKSQLPANYRGSAPAPLVAVQPPPAADQGAAGQGQAQRPAGAAPAPAAPAPSNPAGIRF